MRRLGQEELALDHLSGENEDVLLDNENCQKCVVEQNIEEDDNPGIIIEDEESAGSLPVLPSPKHQVAYPFL